MRPLTIGLRYLTIQLLLRLVRSVGIASAARRMKILRTLEWKGFGSRPKESVYVSNKSTV